jgi:acyl transferase domain-containing protein
MESSYAQPIAIVGVGCRFPGGVHDLASYWKLLSQGTDAITEVPDDRWNVSMFHDSNRAKPGKIVTRWGGFLDQIDQFDASFFGISPREAAHIDPQQRLLLEVSWEALEDAGQIPDALAGQAIGVFIGAFTLDYKILQFRESNRDLIAGHTATGTMMTLIANRLSYCFDFRGPSMAVDTACSSSLVAVHLACQSLQNGECKLALAGGVNVMVTPEYTMAESKAGMLSPDGRCKTFDISANGYVRGEGAGVVLLKPLASAIADGDLIHGVIRGSAVNQDGRTGGITVPRREAQETLIREAYDRAGLSPREVQYVEAHGTGTSVGDPLEANAIGTVMACDRPADSPCWIGSVKTNFGHTEAAAGVAGLLKTVACLQNRQIPPHLHFQQSNPQISFDQLNLKVPTQLTPWPHTDGLRRAGVNSFGFGGTNAHIILEEAPGAGEMSQVRASSLNGSSPHTPSSALPTSYLIPISARCPEALQAIARSYQEFLRDNSVSLQDLAYTLTQRHSHHAYRAGLVVHSQAELIDHLGALAIGEARPGMTIADPQQGIALSMNQAVPTLAFVCSGMGPQWWGMGQELFEREPIFRETLEKIDTLYQEIVGWSLLKEMLAGEDNSRMGDTEVSQPANFALQIGLAELWRSWGIVPDAIIGHSAGEAAAAYLSGVLSLRDAILVNYWRSHLQQRMTGQGKLVAVGLSQQDAEQLIVGYEDRVEIAAINSPNSVALVGDRPTLEAIIKPLEERQVFCKFVFGEVPYHSRYMDPLREELLDALKSIQPTQAKIPLYSTSLGRPIKGDDMDAEYWWKNVRQPVLFFPALRHMIDDGYTNYLELSPHPVLSGVVSESLLHQGRRGAACPSLRRKKPELETMMTSLGALYAQGFSLNWPVVTPEGGQLIRLPAYPWQREHYWQESAQSQRYRLGSQAHPLLGQRDSGPYPVWHKELELRHAPYLEDHRIQGAVVYPGAAYVEMGLTAVKEVFDASTSGLCIKNIEFHKALFIPEGEAPKLQVVVDPDSGIFKIYSQSSANGNTLAENIGGREGTGALPPQGGLGHRDWTLHAQGQAKLQDWQSTQPIELGQLQQRCSRKITQEACYRQFRTLGLEYGETFQGIRELWQGEQEALARVYIPDEIQTQLSDYSVHPAVLDVCFQVLAAALPFNTNPDEATVVYLPIGVETGWFVGRFQPQMWIHARIDEQSDTLLKGDIRLLDQAGNLLLKIQGCRAMSLRDDSAVGVGGIAPGYYEFNWQPQERVIPETENSQPEHGKVPEQETSGERVGSWIILSDCQGVGADLAHQIEAQGGSVVMIKAGESYEETIKGSHYQVNPDKTGGFQQLFAAIPQVVLKSCQGIIHLWSLDIPPTAQLDVSGLQIAEELGCNSVLDLIQALVQQNWRKSPKLWLVTANAQQIPEQSRNSNVAQAALWGMARCLGHQEHRDIWGGIVDLDGAELGQAGQQLYAEILENDGEDQIAFRHGERYVARLQNSGDLASPLNPSFRLDGAYLITGGFGGLGLLVADWMVEQGARHLILMGRNSLPPRAEWSQVVPDSKAARQITAIQALEKKGANVYVLTADVTDGPGLKQAIARYEAEQRPMIRGVIHSAGTAFPQILLQMTRDGFNDVLRPKVRGAWTLHEYFRDRPLDFFVLFSSIASLVVSTGQGNYAAGNAFMDALAAYRQSQGLPGLSVNWGPWAEVGMATQLDLLEFFEKRGNYTISPDQGLSILGDLMGQARPQVGVVAADWPTVAERNYVMGIAPPMLADLVAEGQQNQAESPYDDMGEISVLEQIAQAPLEERQTILENHLRNLAARVLRLDTSRLTVDQPLNAWGLDSMMAIELKNHVEYSLNVGLAVVDLLSGPSITQLADKLLLEINVEDSDSDSEMATDEALLALLEAMPEADAVALLEKV